jgi:hypothetical protein
MPKKENLLSDPNNNMGMVMLREPHSHKFALNSWNAKTIIGGSIIGYQELGVSRIWCLE